MPDFTIRSKVWFLSIIGIGLAIFATIGGIYSINAIGGNLKEIAEEDIPLSNAVSTISQHQLEQAVLFERASRYAQILEADKLAAMRIDRKEILKHYDESKHHFLELAKNVDKEIHQAKEKTEHVLSTAKQGSALAEEFTHVYEVLEKVEKEHADFDHHVEMFFAEIEKGNLEGAEKLAVQIEEEEKQLDHELSALSAELQNFTYKAALKAEQLEKVMIVTLSISSGTAIVLLFLFSGALTKGITGPLKIVEEATKQLADGKLDVEIPEFKNRDEIKAVADALIVLRDNSLRAKMLEEQHKAEQAEKLRIADMIKQGTEDFDVNVSANLKKMIQATSTLNTTSKNLLNVSETGKAKSEQLRQTSETASSNVNTVASASEEMLASIKEINMQISKSSEISSGAVSEADQAGRTIGKLSDASDKIGEVVNLIQDIAEKTNLLALNATIEAARAGDAGKGFAVVANEVKSLAAQTAKATEEITTQITDMQDSTGESVTAIGHIQKTIDQLNEISASVASAMEEQSIAIQEIVQNTQSAAEQTNEVGNISSIVSESSLSTQSASNDVSKAANDMEGRTNDLRGQVETFLAKIKALNGSEDAGSSSDELSGAEIEENIVQLRSA